MPLVIGGGNKCATCSKSVYPQEQLVFEGRYYHSNGCFVCSICKSSIQSTSKAGSMDGLVSHRLCFEKQMRTSGGRYGGEKVVAGGKIAAMAANAAAGTGAVIKAETPTAESDAKQKEEIAKAEAEKEEATKAEAAKAEAEKAAKAEAERAAKEEAERAAKEEAERAAKAAKEEAERAAKEEAENAAAAAVQEAQAAEPEASNQDDTPPLVETAITAEA